MIENKIALVEAQMLIRRPVAAVFEAFIDPEITRNFWFTKGSGRLEAGETLTWEWETYQVSSNIVVKEVLENKKITIDWAEPATAVDFEFQSLGEGLTYVVIRQYGLQGTGDELLGQVKDFTGGFTTVLDGLKAYMEHGINLNLIEDKFPKGIN